MSSLRSSESELCPEQSEKDKKAEINAKDIPSHKSCLQQTAQLMRRPPPPNSLLLYVMHVYLLGVGKAWQKDPLWRTAADMARFLC